MAKILTDTKYKIVIYALVFSFLAIIALIITISTMSGREKNTQPIAIVTNSGDIAINYLDGNEIKLNKAKKGEHTYTFSITNNGTTKNYYSIYIRNCEISKNDVTVRLETENGEKLYNDQLVEGENILLTIKSLEAGTTERYKIIISNRSVTNIKGEIEVVNDSLNEQTFADLILNTNNITEAKTNVGVDSSISNEGLIASMDNDGPTYYFRGAVDNNYLKIGDHMFRVVRINGDETVRVVLDEPLDLKTAYNQNDAEDKKTLSKLEGSTVKEQLYKWVTDNFANYKDYFAASSFCIDTDFINESVDGKRSNTYQRVYKNNNVSFKCNGTVEKHSVGLLSADEILFAGASKEENNKNYYLYNNEINYNVWTIGSYELKNDGTLTMIILSSNGGLITGENIKENNGVRPVLNISTSAHVRGQGTKENPYILVV